MIKKTLPFLILSSSAFAELPGEVTDTQFNFGYKQSSNSSSLAEEPYEHKLFVEGKGSYYYLNEYEGPGVNYDLRFYSELDELSTDKGPNVDVRELTANYKGGSFTFSAGRQTVTWSETFGLNIMDIVNPRDYTYAIFDDLEWSKRPVWLVNSKLFGENWFVELYLNPYGENNKLAEKGSEFDIYRDLSFSRIEPSEHKPEYGARANYLFKNGLDLSLIYYRHMNRNPFYELNSKLELEQNTDMVNSYGATFSYSTDSWVFRGDMLLNRNNPVQKELLSSEKKDWYQSIVGADYSGLDQLVLAAQVMTDSLNSEEWVALQFSKEFEEFEVGAMAVVGTDNSDLWIRPEFKWTGYESLTFKTRFDYIHGDSTSGMMGAFKDNKRVSLELNYIY